VKLLKKELKRLKYNKMNKYQSILIDLRNSDDNEITKNLQDLKNNYLNCLEEDGTFWILTNFKREKNEMLPIPFEICNKFTNNFLKNIILVPDFNNISEGIFFDNCTYLILFFSKNKKYYFNKDPIREKHIWKDVEWGKRKKNYHPLGKDPGNVWIKTEDDGKGKITNHILLPFEEVIGRIIKSSSKNNEDFLLINFKENKWNIR